MRSGTPSTPPVTGAGSRTTHPRPLARQRVRVFYDGPPRFQRTAPPMPSPRRPLSLTHLLVLLAAGSVPAVPALAQQSGSSPGSSAGAPPASREAIWFAPTAEDWAKPCLIHWQRTWEDALRVSRETGRPILICVNMDGEIASEHYAGVRYRRPETAALYDPYVCVIASVYRHTPRDYDAEGNRIPCPRFGTVTCGEHIAIEPILYEQFFDGQRVAPRHIMVELDGGESYDVYYALDTDSVFRTIEQGVAGREFPERPELGDRSPEELVSSPDSRAREIVEEAYREGSVEVRRRILQAAARARDVDQTDLLRLALLGDDPDLRRVALRELLRSRSEKAVDLIVEVLNLPLEAEDRESLIAALERMGEHSERARVAAAIQRGLERRGALDVEAWAREVEVEYAAAARRDIERAEARLAAGAAALEEYPENPSALVDLAESSLILAMSPDSGAPLGADRTLAREHRRLLLEDAQRAARRAKELGAGGWRLEATIALCAYYLGDREAAYRRAPDVVHGLTPGDTSWTSMAALGLLAEARREAIRAAVRQKRSWPPEWLAELNDAYDALARHPLGTAEQVVAHYDFLNWLGGKARAEAVLRAGLERFPDSPLLHDRLRGRILASAGLGGVGRLESLYDAMLREDGASPNLEWFAGYASLVVAEYHRRAGLAGEAEAAYERAIGHFERWIEVHPEARESADHYVAIAFAGRARLALEAGRDDSAVDWLLLSFERAPTAAGALDGLGLSAVATARMLRARLAEAGRGDLEARLAAALDALPPAAFAPPEFERNTPRWRPRSAGRGRRGG